MIRRTAEVREKLLRDFAVGNQSAAEFCRARGINEQTFSCWRKQYATTVAGPLPAVMVNSFRQIHPDPAPLSKVSPIPHPSGLMVAIGGARIFIDTHFDPVVLRRVVEALS